jgi:hypothetical protein
MGATPLDRWHCWQLRCRIGAISFANVMSPGAAAGWDRRALGDRRAMRTATKHASRSPDARDARVPLRFMGGTSSSQYILYRAENGREGVTCLKCVEHDGLTDSVGRSTSEERVVQPESAAPSRLVSTNREISGQFSGRPRYLCPTSPKRLWRPPKKWRTVITTEVLGKGSVRLSKHDTLEGWL